MERGRHQFPRIPKGLNHRQSRKKIASRHSEQNQEVQHWIFFSVPHLWESQKQHQLEEPHPVKNQFSCPLHCSPPRYHRLEVNLSVLGHLRGGKGQKHQLPQPFQAVRWKHSRSASRPGRRTRLEGCRPLLSVQLFPRQGRPRCSQVLD